MIASSGTLVYREPMKNLDFNTGKEIIYPVSYTHLKGILNFNEMVQADSRVENILLPVRHGLMIVRKV